MRAVRKSRRAFFDVDGKPTLDTDGGAEYRYTFDDRGNIKETECFGVDGKPALTKAGYARREIAFDDRGR